MTGALLFLTALVAAESVTAFVDVVVGIAFHVVLMFLLILLSSHAAPPLHKLYLALALVPLIRIVSLSMPSSEISQTYRYLLISLPLFIGMLVAIRVLRFRPSDVGLTLDSPVLQGLVACTGVGFGWIEFVILRPDPLVANLTLGEVIPPALILLVATGFVEELAFRGIIQRSAEETLGSWGWVYTAVVSSVLYIGYLRLSVGQWIFVLLAALFFGWVVKRSGSLLGVTLSHGTINIVAYIVLPSLIH